MTHYTLSLLSEKLVVAQLPACEGVRFEKDQQVSLWAVIYSRDEITFVGPASSVPENAVVEPGWRAFEIAGPLDFSLIGVISTLSAVLAEAQVSVFVLSTYSTDFILVKEQQLKNAVSALRSAGCIIQER